MVTLDWSLERSEGVTLVGLVVAAERPCRVRVENRLDGPVWPPRHRGQPAAGWDDGVFTGEVPADGRLTVGYASPAPPEEPPAEVVSTEPVAEADGADAGERSRASPVPAVDQTPAGVVRALGDPVVPRDGVPVPAPDDGRYGPTNETTAGDPDSHASGGTAEARDETPEQTRAGARTDSRGQPLGDAGRTERPAGAEALLVPSDIRTWLRDVEARLDAAERERTVNSGRQGADRPLAAAQTTDRRALQQVRQRVDELLVRCDEDGSVQRNGKRRATDASGDAVER
ncbi:DUF7857 domain-containing protein [Halosimplex sp. J119]